MSEKAISWSLFSILSVIWGSSFILMKEGLKELSALEVAALRMLSAGIVLFPFAVKGIRNLSGKELTLIILSGILGSFIPAVLFCVAETKIDSALAGMLNALTPLFVVLMGVLLFQSKTNWGKVAGIIVGFSGMVLLFFAQKKQAGASDINYALLVLLATLFYGFNVNMVNRYLRHIGSTQIAAVAFAALILPSLLVLGWENFHLHNTTTNAFLKATAASVVLGVFGTAIASIFFYMLMKRTGPLFSSMVTYGIPFVAVFWGLIAGESITILQMLGLFIILAGVYITSRF
jgi:drug/metabolite transporter (DMT)-like permease